MKTRFDRIITCYLLAVCLALICRDVFDSPGIGILMAAISPTLMRLCGYPLFEIENNDKS